MDETTYDHESYVLVSFSRTSGTTGRLFGSSLAEHYTSVRLQVHRAYRLHSLSHDKYYPSSNKRLLEIELSPAQFAELLTSMNVGSGVPATLRILDGKAVEIPPDEPLEIEKVRTGFNSGLQKLVSTLKTTRAKVATIIEKKTPLSKENRGSLLEFFDYALREVSANVPFILEQFQEAADKVVTHAKAEIDAAMLHTIIVAGFKSVTGKNALPQLQSIPSTHDNLEDTADSHLVDLPLGQTDPKIP